MENENCKKMIIPKGTKKIGDYKFLNSKMEEVVLPDGVKEIGEGSFYGCEELEKINFPKSLKKINDEAFKYCSNLKNIVIEHYEGLNVLIEYIDRIERFTKTPQWCSNDLVISVRSPFELAYNVKGYEIGTKDNHFLLTFKGNYDLFSVICMTEFLETPTNEKLERFYSTPCKVIMAMASCGKNKQLIDYFNQYNSRPVKIAVEQAISAKDPNTFSFLTEHELISKKDIDRYIEMIIKNNEDTEYDHSFLANVYIELVKYKEEKLGMSGNTDIAKRFDL